MNPAKRPRLSVVETVYYQQPDSSPLSVVSRFSRWCNSDEQPWIRHAKATEQWQSLDCGWIKEGGMLVLENNEGQVRQTIPTEAERAETAAKVIEVSCATNTSEAAWLVLPGESMRVHPANLAQIEIRCRAGTAKYTLTLLPG